MHLALDSPLIDKNSKLGNALKLIDLVLTIVFAIEAMLKIVAFGLINNGKQSYFNSLFNILDFFIVIISVILDKNN